MDADVFTSWAWPTVLGLVFGCAFRLAPRHFVDGLPLSSLDFARPARRRFTWAALLLGLLSIANGVKFHVDFDFQTWSARFLGQIFACIGACTFVARGRALQVLTMRLEDMKTLRTSAFEVVIASGFLRAYELAMLEQAFPKIVERGTRNRRDLWNELPTQRARTVWLKWFKFLLWGLSLLFMPVCFYLLDVQGAVDTGSFVAVHALSSYFFLTGHHYSATAFVLVIAVLGGPVLATILPWFFHCLVQWA